MARDFSRRHRVAEELKRELGFLIASQVKDPRVQFVSISDVDVSPDLKHAKVYVANFDVTAAEDSAKRAVAGLHAAEGFLKRELGKRLRLRVMPELRFVEDTTEREAQKLDSLIASAVAEDESRTQDATDDGDEDGTHGAS
ncbi:30S ribosome-binding factor RbfA [Salinisphaera sp. Q1T1-3]|uniref:30S ribosome-binding factor RbfA n=1 Tax=Salinisphaera sp. Q1T1-3 TaxID=2321229 RepID=UPI000E74D5F0|nr:30S ribosome-binding factor RbfA [Salinisphaera sp. Q1T1-3]RJS92711.1 30S ribosome-binding factor RbfA [Salinisphaera sp. Q1T1-3]